MKRLLTVLASTALSTLALQGCTSSSSSSSSSSSTSTGGGGSSSSLAVGTSHASGSGNVPGSSAQSSQSQVATSSSGAPACDQSNLTPINAGTMRLGEPKTVTLCPANIGSYFWFKLPGTTANQQSLRLQVSFARGASATDWDFDVGAFPAGDGGVNTDPTAFTMDVNCFAGAGMNEDCHGALAASDVGPVYVRVQQLQDSSQETVTMTLTEAGQGNTSSSGPGGSSSGGFNFNCAQPTNTTPATALEMPLGTPFNVSLCPQNGPGLTWWRVRGTTCAGQNVRLTVTFARGTDASDWDFFVGGFPVGDAGVSQNVDDFTLDLFCQAAPGVNEDCSGPLSTQAAGPIMVQAQTLVGAQPEDVTFTVTQP